MNIDLAMTHQFDSAFFKAMQLLHSVDKDATVQLKAMLDESLAQRKTVPVMAIQKMPVPTIKPVGKIRKPAPTQKPILIPTSDVDRSGSSCVICKKCDSKPGNDIIECQECHNLYHQECHKPSLINRNVKDPRFVWYCSTCTSRQKRIKLLPNKPAVSTGNTSASRDTRDHHKPEVSPFKSWSFVKE